MVRLVPLVLLLLLATATVQAAPSPVERLQPWLAPAGAQQAQPVPVTPEISAPYLSRAELGALGDINGDGRDDVVFVETTSGGENPPETEVRALSGADLKDDLWRFAGPAEEYLSLWDDVDGDGIHDLLSDSFTGQGTGDSVSPVPVPSFYAYQFNFQFTSAATLWSGRSGSVVGTLEDHYEDQNTDAGVGLPVGGGYAGTTASAYATSSLLPGGRILVQDSKFTGAGVSAYTPVEGASIWVSDEDATGRIMNWQGDVSAEFAMTSPDQFPLGFTALPRSGDDPLLAALWLDRPPTPSLDAPAVAPSRLHIAAVEGSTVLWEAVTPPDLYLELEAVPLADLNADGVTELQTLEFTLDPRTPSLVRVETVIRDGATGADVIRILGDNRFTVYLPFGDLEDDGSPELLWASVSFDFEDVTFGVARSDFTSIWQSTTSGFPINFAAGSGDEEFRGLTDWTGDGAPDIVLLEETAGLLVLDGKTGAQVWQRVVLDNERVSLLGESTGTGAGDLAITKTTGVVEVEDGIDNGTQAVLTIEIVAGETGERIRTQVLRDPALIPAGAAGARARAGTAGDVDGDGRDDFIVLVYDYDIVEEVEDGETQTYTRARPTSYLFSLSKDAPLLVVGAMAASEVGSAAALPAPEGGLVDTPKNGSKGSPGTGFGFVLVALVAVVLARRR